MELYKKHRPNKLMNVIGQNQAIKPLIKMIKNNNIPHAILLTGPSGCGKTTIGRILAKHTKCNQQDFREINCADFRGIDMVRDIRSRINQAPLMGDSIVYLIDECHKLSNDAQNAFLKLLEDTPNHVYFLLATTDPQKLLNTVKTRCTKITVKSLGNNDITTLIKNTCKKEDLKITDNVIDKITENSAGSARAALVLLNTIANLPNEKEMLEAIVPEQVQQEAFKIAQSLFRKTNWSSMSKILRETDISKHEGLRHMILGYAKKVLLSGGKQSPVAFLVIDSFSEPFFNSGEAGLVAACYEIINDE